MSALAQSIMQLAGGRSRAIVVPWRSLFEAALVAATLALLLPAFLQLRAAEEGRDQRFRTDALHVDGLPAPVLPTLCQDVGALAEQVVSARLCARVGASTSHATLEALPAPLQAAYAQAFRAFALPLQTAAARIE